MQSHRDTSGDAESGNSGSGIRPFSHGKTNDAALALVSPFLEKGRAILDLGAGAGYFTRMLYRAAERKGLSPENIIRASDYHPQDFLFDKIACEFGDFNAGLPYADNSFDAVCCIEVVEHIEDQFRLLREIYRIVKPGGIAVVSTPNIMNINSRLSFLGYGLYPLFDILPASGERGTLEGHIHPVSWYFLSFMARRAGFRRAEFYPDRIKRSAMLYLLPFYPFIWLAGAFYRHKTKRRNPALYEENAPALRAMNSLSLLTSRTVVAKLQK